MVSEAEVTKNVSPEMERTAAQRAKDKANAARWNLDIAIFLFAVLIIIIILLFQGVSIELVAPVAIFGLAMVWLTGWKQGRQLYQRFYDDELAKLEQQPKETVKKAVEDTVEEMVRKALRDRER